MYHLDVMTARVSRKLAPAKYLLDLGTVPTMVTIPAAEMLSRLPRKAMGAVLADLRRWLEDVPITGSITALYVDPEDETSRYVLIHLLSNANDEDFEELSKELAQVDEASVDKLPTKDRERVVASYQVTLTRPGEWDDKPAFCI